MPEISEEWVRSQFEAAKVKVNAGKAVLKLLNVWNELKLSEPQRKEAIALFSKIALGHALVVDTGAEVWEPAGPGRITVGDEVRVLADAYDGSLGMIHNGRRGKVVGVRYGDVIFKSTDGKDPLLDGAHYSPYKLEKRIKQ